MTPEEHFCHSRLVVPAQTSKAREGTHHLLVVSGFSRRGQQVRHRPPQAAWCFPSLLEIPLTRLHHLAPGKKHQNHHKNNRSCVMIVSCMFHVSQKPTSFVGDSANRIPPKKNIAGLRNCWVLLGVATSVTTSLKAKGACSTGLFTSTATKYENESTGQNGEINRFSSWRHQNHLLKNFCQRVKSNLTLLNKNCWSLKRCLRSRSPRPKFHGHPREGCSRSLLHGKFRTFFGWRHWENATER